MEKGIARNLTALSLAIATTASYAYQDVTPYDADNMVLNSDNVYIVDVRTDAEWRWVGHPGSNNLEEGPHLDGKVVNISYKIFKKDSFITNPSFISDMEDIFPNKGDVTLITMCRSGKRSVAAALALEAAGYTNVANMLTGFEGDKDAYGYRTVNGWKVDGLSYKASGTDEYSD